MKTASELPLGEAPVITHLNQINAAIASEGGRPFFVGGCVRDELMGLSPKDFDVEVFGLVPHYLKSLLGRFGTVNEVGESFSVMKLRLGEIEVDFSVPRRERKAGEGHKGFVVEADPFMPLSESAARRDFTINAIYKNAVKGHYYDPFGGIEDIKKGRLHPTSPRFSEDPLRVLRGMQFAGRFGMWPSVDCQVACLKVLGEYTSLPKERVWAEWYKWATLSTRPSMGLDFLQMTGWINLYEELTDMIGCIQHPLYHPEGWSANEIEWGSDTSHPLLFSDQSSLTSPTKTIGGDDRLGLREFFLRPETQATCGVEFRGTRRTQTPRVNLAVDSLSATSVTGSSSFGLTPRLAPTVPTQTQSLVWTFAGPAVPADEIVRVVFKVPLRSVIPVMNTTVDDCEVVQAIIHPVTVYVMNMLIAEKTSTNFQFHQVSVNADSTFTAGDMHVNVSSVVIDTENFPIDGDVVCYLDLAVIRNINSFTHGNHPQKADVGVKYEITPHRFLEVTIGDVFTHTKHVCDAAAEIADRVGLTGEDRAVLLFTALCHDMGKPFTTVFEREAWRSPGHDSAGVPIARQFLESIGCLERIIVRVLPLIAEHMFPVWTSINRRTVRRLKLRLEPSTVDELLRLMEADASGRPPLPKGLPNGAQRLIELNQDLPPKIEPVVTGRHIMDLGITDGKTIGAIKRRVFEAQIEEVFDASDLSAAINFTRNLINTEYAHAAAWRTYPVKIQTKD